MALGDPAEVPQGKLTLRVIREVLEQVVRQRQRADPHLHCLSDLELYGAPDHAEHPLPDDLHPDAETHVLIGARFAERLGRYSSSSEASTSSGTS